MLERLSAIPAGQSAGVHIGTEAFAIAGTTDFSYSEKMGLGALSIITFEGTVVRLSHMRRSRLGRQLLHFGPYWAEWAY